jgi:hypothetical protein
MQYNMCVILDLLVSIIYHKTFHLSQFAADYVWVFLMSLFKLKKYSLTSIENNEKRFNYLQTITECVRESMRAKKENQNTHVYKVSSLKLN